MKGDVSPHIAPQMRAVASAGKRMNSSATRKIKRDDLESENGCIIALFSSARNSRAE